MADDFVPTRRQLGQLARATLDNASALVEDAQVLQAKGRTERAFAMAILALEEFGKHLSCVGAATRANDRVDGTYWGRFWKNFMNHHAKYGVALAALTGALPLELSSSLIDEFPQRVLEDQQRKLAALYVDFQSGEVLAPTDMPGETSTEAVRIAGELVGGSTEHWRDVDFEALFDRGVGHRHPAIGEAMASANAEELARLVLAERQALLKDGPPN